MKKNSIFLAMVIAIGAAHAWAQAPSAQQKIEPKKLIEESQVIQQRNQVIQQANDAMAAKQYDVAAAALKQLIQAEPARLEYYGSLGVALLNLGQFDESILVFEKGIQLAPADAKFTVAQMLTNEGNAYLKLKKNDRAIAAFEKAAALDPNPATAYYNLCATQYNMGDMAKAVAACDKSLAAEPSKENAYFIKGSALYGLGKLDAQGKYVVSEGAVASLQKYLQLAPSGPHATDVKAMLDAVGVKVETTYKPNKK